MPGRISILSSATGRSGRCSERPSLVPYTGRFDWFHAVTASVSKTCLVRFDTNRYSVAAGAVGRPVEIRAYAERIELRQDGHVVGEHRRSLGRDQMVFDPWHYVPVLARKPGAWRNGAPFKDWLLPGALERVRRKLAGVGDGDRQMVDILARQREPPAPLTILTPNALRLRHEPLADCARYDSLRGSV